MANTQLLHLFFLFLPSFFSVFVKQNLISQIYTINKPYKHNKLSEREPRVVGEGDEEGEEYVPINKTMRMP